MNRLLCLLFLLAACDTPSPAFWNAPVQKVEVDGSYFDIRHQGEVAEAIRVNAESRPMIGVIARKAELAMEQATGCTVKTMQGDVAILKGGLDCRQPPVQEERAVWKRPPKSGISCLGVRLC